MVQQVIISPNRIIVETNKVSNTVENAKSEFNRAKNKMNHLLATTPDDRINWSPSDSCRTPIHQVAHAALAITGIQDFISGKPFPFASMEDLDAFSRNAEKEYSTREQVLALLEGNSSSYFKWLDSLTDDQLSSVLETKMGTFPMSFAVTFPAQHIQTHCAQMEYIQTIYGDLNWHMG